MQEPVTNILWIVYGGSGVLIIFSIAYVLVVVHSQTHKIRLQNEKLAEVQRSEQKYKTLFDHAPAGMIKFDYRSFEILDANDALYHMFSCTSLFELQRYLILLGPDQQGSIQSRLEKEGAIKEYELSIRDFDNKSRWVLFSARREQEGTTAYGVFWDITQRKLYEEIIEEHAALLNQTQDGVIVISLEGQIIFWNTAAAEMYGWDDNEVFGKNIETILFRADFREDYRACSAQVAMSGAWSGEQRHVVKSGKVILVESNWKKIDNPFHKTSTVLIVNTDITEKRALEKRSLHNQKMEGIALMTSGIAHDLQNILAPVSLSINLLRDELIDPSKEYIIDSIEESTISGLQLIKNILLVGRGINGIRKPFDLITTIEIALRIFSHGEPENITIHKHFSRRECLIVGDDKMMRQMFLNLFQNSKDAMPGGGTLSVTLQTLGKDSLHHTIDLESSADEYASIEVSDTGIGIPEELQDKIFEPFFTTKEGTGGTGLGLPFVKNLVRNHGGHIAVRSHKEGGAIFTIILPIKEP